MPRHALKLPNGELELIVYVGGSFTLPISWKDSDGNPRALADYTARMHIRESISDPQPLINLSKGSGIELADTLPNITITITDEQTKVITARRGVYDLELESSGGEVIKLLPKGPVRFEPEVTRE